MIAKDARKKPLSISISNEYYQNYYNDTICMKNT